MPAGENLTMVQGTATSADDVRQATVDADAVIVTLGTKSSVRPRCSATRRPRSSRRWQGERNR
ncbi:hypothetical protein ACWEAF_13930 [Streptomyces sp. NPDC005071]